mgnify:CR=1 FL=1
MLNASTPSRAERPRSGWVGVGVAPEVTEGGVEDGEQVGELVPDRPRHRAERRQPLRPHELLEIAPQHVLLAEPEGLEEGAIGREHVQVLGEQQQAGGHARHDLVRVALEIRHRARLAHLLLEQPRALLLDIAGPLEVLRWTNTVQDRLRFDVRYVGPQETVTSSIGLQLGGIATLPAELQEESMVVLAGSVTHVLPIGGNMTLRIS